MKGADTKRIYRTKGCIRRAFLDLLNEKEIENISIGRIAEAACVNRSTVYRHYEDIHDILRDCLDVYCGAMGRVVPDPGDPSFFCKLRRNIQLGAGQIKKHQRLYLAGSFYIKKNPRAECAQRIDRQNIDHQRQVLTQLGIGEQNSLIPINYLIVSGRGIINSLFEIWTTNGCKEPVEAFTDNVVIAYFGFLYSMSKDQMNSPLRNMLT